jgi:hypothetical protein
MTVIASEPSAAGTSQYTPPDPASVLSPAIANSARHRSDAASDVRHQYDHL